MAKGEKNTFHTFDVAEHLDSPEVQAAFLSAAMDEAEGDPSAVTHALNTLARAQNMSQLAREAGITREGLYKALSPQGNPSFDLVYRLANSLGLRLTVTSAKAKPKRKGASAA